MSRYATYRPIHCSFCGLDIRKRPKETVEQYLRRRWCSRDCRVNLRDSAEATAAVHEWLRQDITRRIAIVNTPGKPKFIARAGFGRAPLPLDKTRGAMIRSGAPEDEDAAPMADDFAAVAEEVAEL